MRKKLMKNEWKMNEKWICFLIVTTSTSSYNVLNPSMDLQGRTLAYRLNSFLNCRLRDLNPLPIGVIRGLFKPILLRLTESMAAWEKRNLFFKFSVHKFCGDEIINKIFKRRKKLGWQTTFLRNLSKYFACLPVSLFVSNKRQNS